VEHAEDVLEGTRHVQDLDRADRCGGDQVARPVGARRDRDVLFHEVFGNEEDLHLGRAAGAGIDPAVARLVPVGPGLDRPLSRGKVDPEAAVGIGERPPVSNVNCRSRDGLGRLGVDDPALDPHVFFGGRHRTGTGEEETDGQWSDELRERLRRAGAGDDHPAHLISLVSVLADCQAETPAGRAYISNHPRQARPGNRMFHRIRSPTRKNVMSKTRSTFPATR